jgi:hypothetical protein
MVDLWGLLAGFVFSSGCSRHLPKLRDLMKRGSPRPATVEDQVNGASWLHETVGLGPMILN